MPERHVVALEMLDRGPAADAARARLQSALGAAAELGEVDGDGLFDVALEAESRERALRRVFDAIAAAGADDHVAFAEHPEIPEHWRPTGRAPSA